MAAKDIQGQAVQGKCPCYKLCSSRCYTDGGRYRSRSGNWRYKTAGTAQREVRNKLKQKYTREAVDDYHRGVFLVGRTAVDAVKGTHNHLKTKKQYKLEKAKLQLKKADNKIYKAKTQKPKMAATKADLKKAKAEYKARIVKDKGQYALQGDEQAPIAGI